jgi:hypothetical protein
MSCSAWGAQTFKSAIGRPEASKPNPTPMRIKHPAEAVGARGEEILSWLGFTSFQIQWLRERQVLFQ